MNPLQAAPGRPSRLRLGDRRRDVSRPDPLMPPPPRRLRT
jgi:hypothetical protein